MVIPTKRTTDKFIARSISKKAIITPNREIKQAKLFIFDDISPLGITPPDELISTLEENNQPTSTCNAQELANQIANQIPIQDIAVVNGGGILSLLFLKRAGYQGQVTQENIINVNRFYPYGSPVVVLEKCPATSPSLIIDDILASGQTLDKIAREYIFSAKRKNLACLMASTNIPQGEKGYRERQGSTLPEIETLFCSELVNGTQRPDRGNYIPAILSLRYLITKALDNDDYKKGYLAKKFGGQENAEKISKLLMKINRSPIDLLRSNPIEFLRRFKGGNPK